MPIFMDRHDILGATAKDVAKAHQQDLKIQDKYKCKALTYWFDEERGIAFCLVEAPDKKAVQEMHDNAHGLIPNHLIEVETNVVESFLGRIEDPMFSHSPVDGFVIINDPAFRTIMVTALPDIVVSADSNNKREQHFLSDYRTIVKSEIRCNSGKEVQYQGNGFLASFTSSCDAIRAALEIRKKLEKINFLPLQMRCGITSGDPVTDNKSLFGQAIQLAARLCFVSSPNGITASSETKECYEQEALNSPYAHETIRMLDSREEIFLNKLFDAIEEHFSDPHFALDKLSKIMCVSKAQLYRKTVSLTGFSPNALMKEFRLIKSLKQIKNREENISGIAYECGFASPSYFSSCFYKRFKLAPSDCSVVAHTPEAIV
ncbi:MAG: nickel-binding protein [Ginsengibacter sp.]